MEDDMEIILYADLYMTGNFDGPFHIYMINGKRGEAKEKSSRSRGIEAAKRRVVKRQAGYLFN